VRTRRVDANRPAGERCLGPTAPLVPSCDPCNPATDYTTSPMLTHDDPVAAPAQRPTAECPTTPTHGTRQPPTLQQAVGQARYQRRTGRQVPHAETVPHAQSIAPGWPCFTPTARTAAAAFHQQHHPAPHLPMPARVQHQHQPSHPAPFTLTALSTAHPTGDEDGRRVQGRSGQAPRQGPPLLHTQPPSFTRTALPTSPLPPERRPTQHPMPSTGPIYQPAHPDASPIAPHEP